MVCACDSERPMLIKEGKKADGLKLWSRVAVAVKSIALFSVTFNLTTGLKPSRVFSSSCF